MKFRLLVINPNSDERVTSDLRSTALAVLPAGAEVEAVGCPRSPLVIETAADDVLAAPDVLRAALRAASPDAYLVGCFGDPAVDALRELVDGPVLGLGAAALMQASIVTSRFGVITTLDRGIPGLWAQLASSGAVAACAGIRSIGPSPVAPAGVPAGAGQTGPGADGEDDLDRLIDRGRQLLAEGADGIVLACAAFGRWAAELGRLLDVPVCDGIGFGAAGLYGLWASGVSTSKRGGYDSPLADVASSLADRDAAPAPVPSATA